MKRFLVITILLTVNFFGIKDISALTLDSTNQIKLNYSFDLRATELQSQNLNSVKISIVVQNGTISKFTEVMDETLLFSNKDCDNQSYFTDKTICFTYLFTTPIIEGQSLGKFEVTRSSSDLSFSIKAISDSAYSDGEISYPIVQTLFEDNVVAESSEDQLAEISPINLGTLTSQTESELVVSAPVVNNDSESETTTEEMPSNTNNENETPVQIEEDNSTTFLATIVGILLLGVVLALLYFVLKPKPHSVSI